MTTTDLATKFTFTKSAINQAVQAFDNQSNLNLRDDHTRGLILRKQSAGWHFGVLRKINNKVHRVAIAPLTPTSDLAQIRAEAERIMQELRRGEFIPAKAKAAVAQTHTDALTMTLGEALALHLRVNPQLRQKTAEEYGRGILWLMDLPTNPGPDGKADPIGTAQRVTQPIGALTTDDIRAAYDRLCNAGKIAAGNSMLRSVRAIWNTWSDETDVTKRNPVLRITAKRGRVQRVEPRTGALEPGQRAEWYCAMEQQARNSATFSTARACQVLFLTGMRRDEVLGLRWADIDHDAKTFTIPAARMKAGKALTRPITREVARIFEAQRTRSAGGPFVFPASRGDGHVADTRKTLAKAPVQITNHDLRRGYIVAGALAMVPEVAVKMLVGHSVSDITQTYTRAIRSELPDLAQQIEDSLLQGVEQ
jgi:integrase